MDHTCLRIFSCFDPETGAEYLGCVDLSEAMAPLPVAAEASHPVLLRRPVESVEENTQPEEALVSPDQAEAVVP